MRFRFVAFSVTEASPNAQVALPPAECVVLRASKQADPNVVTACVQIACRANAQKPISVRTSIVIQSDERLALE